MARHDGRVTDVPCANIVVVPGTEEAEEIRYQRCGNPVPRWQWPMDRLFPIICDGCLRANQASRLPPPQPEALA